MAEYKIINFISGHLDLRESEFEKYYHPLLVRAISANKSFIVGDARGADTMAQKYLSERTEAVVVYHMFATPRNNPGFSTRGGFTSDAQPDAQMTLNSDQEIAWVKPGRKQSGTQANLNCHLNQKNRQQNVKKYLSVAADSGNLKIK
ncbi:hypothetical protein RintRC_4930 [Richelia intracellularis]|nr:hypothetical protein RintRC_4930 [Richelia intracellularis]